MTLIHSTAKNHDLQSALQFSSQFQRAVHLRYDLFNPDAINRYAPTPTALDAILAILGGTRADSTQRSHVLYAAYGSGKSLLAASVAAILSRHASTDTAVLDFAKRTRLISEELAQQLEGYLLSERRPLFPVVLVGDEGDLATALPRALARSLAQAGIELRLDTQYEAAWALLETWHSDYPDAFGRFEAGLHESTGEIIESFGSRLHNHDTDAYALFERLYTQITAGAAFNPLLQYSPEALFKDVVGALGPYGYAGIVIVWDEFGRYLEARNAKAFSSEAAQLQNFAEMCNYSNEHQVHLLLFTHKELQSYASSLPKAFQQEWSRIEGRFQRHSVANDPNISYQLTAGAYQRVDSDTATALFEQCNPDQLAKEAGYFGLFEGMDSSAVYSLVDQTWPLHPVTVFALGRLSNRVAQNERTMFTFLLAEERSSLRHLLNQIDTESDYVLVRPHVLWDYFQDAIRADSGVGGAHKVWSGVAHALDKVAHGDVLSAEVIKTMGVLHIVSEAGAGRPTTDLIAWCVGAQTDEVRNAIVQALENLRRRKVIIHRQIDGFWSFASGSDIDFEQRLNEVLERANPTREQLKRVLERVAPPPYTVARRFNQEHAMTRYFKGIYRWPDELDMPWGALIARSDYPDGLVVYALATSAPDIDHALSLRPLDPRVIFAVPREPLIALEEGLRELFALQELNNDPLFKDQDDRERIQRELDWLVEDAETRLRREIDILINPRTAGATWDEYTVLRTPGEATRFVSHACERVFPGTPVINNEGINKQNPTTQQQRAAEMVIDALFAHQPSSHMGLEGRGPEVLVCSSVLEVTGILCEQDGAWRVGRPHDAALAEVWDRIQGYLDECQHAGPQSLAPLIETLLLPPYGLRKGVMPVLIAAVMRERIKATTVRRGARVIHPINGALLTEMVAEPEAFTIEIGEWNADLENLWAALYQRFELHMVEADRNLDPLARLKLAMLRWLQGLPRYCRDTTRLSDEAATFRQLIRKAQSDPAAVLINDLPELIGIKGKNVAEIDGRVDSLMTATFGSYIELMRRLDQVAGEIFAVQGRVNPSYDSIRSWLGHVEQAAGKPIASFRFGSPTAQALIDTALQDQAEGDQPWDTLSLALTGLHLRDWNDKSEEKFYGILRDAASVIEAETNALLEDTETVVDVNLQLPGNSDRNYRFRSATLSNHAQRVLQNLRSTLDIAGRPLSVDEKRQIAIEFLRYVMGDVQDE